MRPGGRVVQPRRRCLRPLTKQGDVAVGPVDLQQVAAAQGRAGRDRGRGINQLQAHGLAPPRPLLCVPPLPSCKRGS